jgi:hypothetical protein
MVHSIACQTCGEQVMAEYARVFGNDDDELHACPNCSTQRALARGAGVDADRDGTLLVHHPDRDEPVEAVIETDRTDSTPTTQYEFDELSPSPLAGDEQAQGRATSSDEAFEALVAE